MDRTISNAFCHADLGPEDTRAGRIILELTKEMQRPCPNMTLMYREDTPDDYMKAALETAMVSSKPSFANDALYRRDMGDYAVVSCYNTLPIGGCGLTLVRLNMNCLPQLATDPEDLLNRRPAFEGYRSWRTALSSSMNGKNHCRSAGRRHGNGT